jgi:hypothetical protein
VPTIVPTDALSVCNCGASPLTEIVSWRLPSCSVTAMRGVVWTLTWIWSRT